MHRVLVSNTGFGCAFSMEDHGGGEGGWREMAEIKPAIPSAVYTRSQAVL